MDAKLRDFVEKSIELLSSVGDVEILRYPSDQRARSVDAALRVSGKGSIIVKLSRDTSEVGRAEREELKRLSATMKVNAFVVANSRDGQELIKGVIYDLEGLKVLTPETIVDAARDYEQPAIFEDRDGFKIKISGEVLRSLRIGKGYSRGALAERLGVSRRTIYDYEREAVKPTLEIAEKIIREFGEDVVMPVNIFDSSEEVVASKASSQGPPLDSRVEEIIVERLKRNGWKLYHARRAPLDIVVAKESVSVLLTVPHARDDVQQLSDRFSNMSKLARIVRGYAYLVAERERSSELKRIIDDSGLVLTVDELLEALGELHESGKASRNNW